MKKSIRTILHEEIYNKDDKFDNFLEELSKNTGSQITKDDVVRSSDGLRINLNESSIKGINNTIKSSLNDINADYSGLISESYNITKVNDSIMVIL